MEVVVTEVVVVVTSISVVVVTSISVVVVMTVEGVVIVISDVDVEVIYIVTVGAGGQEVDVLFVSVSPFYSKTIHIFSWLKPTYLDNRQLQALLILGSPGFPVNHGGGVTAGFARNLEQKVDAGSGERSSSCSTAA